MLLKVCGMREQENIRRVAELKPEMMGFIFYDKSPRNVRGMLEKKAMKAIPSSVKKVAVFVDPKIDEVAEIVAKFDFDVVQLHGDETPELVRAVKNLGIGVIKAVPGNREFSHEYMKAIEPDIDFWLLDTRTEKHGGTGITFDRAILDTFDFDKPVLLSGGLDSNSVKEIRKEDHPVVAGIDVNSRVEDMPGMKNIEKLKAVIECLK